MKKIFFIAILASLFSSCSKDNFIDTGKANTKYNGTILTYLKGDKFNWDLTVEMINRAGLNNLFDGKDAAHPVITFVGPTKFSILRYMLQNGYDKVTDIPVDDCKDFILRHVIDGKKLKADIPKGRATLLDDTVVPSVFDRSGGVLLTSIQGTKIFLYTFTQSFAGVANAGPTYLYLESENANVKQDIASADIEPTNGVVHSLHYNYTLGDL